MVILICGFMGAGKSTLLSHLIGFDTLDLDQYILESFPHYRNLADLIEDKGMQGFRLIESLSLGTLLDENLSQSRVIALGGGTLNPETLALIKTRGKLVWLKTPLEDCLRRIKEQNSLRPLAILSNEELSKLYFEREKYYCQADFTGESSGEVVEIVTNLVNRHS